MNGFVTAGVVPVDSDVYVPRAFEDEAFVHLTSKQADWVLLLGPRQHGKSSGLARLAKRLDENGFVVAFIDLQAYGADADYPSLLRWIASRVAAAIDRPTPAVTDDGQEDLEAWLTAALEDVDGSVCVFLDEAAAVPEPHRKRLYSQLRALFNARRLSGKPQAIVRLVFLFCGTFRPERLVDPDNSPFNVSKEVRTADLTDDDAVTLALAGGTDLEDAARYAYGLVGGQPYLLQVLLSAASGDRDAARERIDIAFGRLRDGTDRHATAMFERVVEDPSSVDAVGAMVEGDGATDLHPADPTHAWLQVLGVAAADGGKLRFRNPLYRQFAEEAPQLRNDPETGAAIQPGVLLRLGLALDAVADEEARRFASEAADSAVDAFNAGHHRLALIGFGSALEAVLLAHLEGLLEADLRAARDRLTHDRPSRLNPASWNLKNMARVAHETSALAQANLALSHALRDWRNQVHLDVARRSPLTNAELGPEAQLASATLQIVLRELGRNA